MGTNFYVHVPGEREPWHLGKRSAGWPFLFHAESYWRESMALRLWLARAFSGVVKDEYGRRMELADLYMQILDTMNDTNLHPGAYVNAGFQFMTGEFC
jgi:hypothetical protein